VQVARRRPEDGRVLVLRPAGGRRQTLLRRALRKGLRQKQQETEGRPHAETQPPSSAPRTFVVVRSALTTSACGYERKFWGPLIFVRFTPQSRHTEAQCPLLGL